MPRPGHLIERIGRLASAEPRDVGLFWLTQRCPTPQGAGILWHYNVFYPYWKTFTQNTV